MNVLLIGGTSEIGLAIMRRAWRADTPVRAFLLGRDRERVAAAAATLERAEYDVLDADALDTHEQVVARAFERAGGLDVVVLAVGVLGGQEGLDTDRSVSERVMSVNFLGSGSLLLASLRALRRAGARHDGRPLERRGGARTALERDLWRGQGGPRRAGAGPRRLAGRQRRARARRPARLRRERG